MTVVGIDFSILSTAICIKQTWQNNDEMYHFISINSNSYPKKMVEELKKNYVEVYTFDRHQRYKEYSRDEVIKVQEALDLADLILRVIPSDVDLIVIEGFSYHSTNTNATLDLCLYNSILRAKLYETYGRDKLRFVPPTKVKKRLANKGNASKQQMIEAFKDNTLDDNTLIKTPFFRYVRTLDKLKKPIDDLVDSYAVLQC